MEMPAGTGFKAWTTLNNSGNRPTQTARSMEQAAAICFAENEESEGADGTHLEFKVKWCSSSGETSRSEKTEHGDAKTTVL